MDTYSKWWALLSSIHNAKGSACHLYAYATSELSSTERSKSKIGNEAGLQRNLLMQLSCLLFKKKKIHLFGCMESQSHHSGSFTEAHRLSSHGVRGLVALQVVGS